MIRGSDSTNFHFEEGEILNFNKPLGMTSFRLVSQVRGVTQCKKVGHAGTLDPLATGVLMVCTGKATKRVNALMELDKVYEGEIQLGHQTETDDAEGAIVATADVPAFDINKIEAVLTEFTGEVKQVPPVYSAIRVNGRRAYKRARQGEKIIMPPRIVTIHEITVCSWEWPVLKICVRCAKGTYIRSLARDIGMRLGSGGYLKTLRRVAVGSYRVEDAWQLETFKKMVTDHASLSVA